jgi:hypothetical protein
MECSKEKQVLGGEDRRSRIYKTDQDGQIHGGVEVAKGIESLEDKQIPGAEFAERIESLEGHRFEEEPTSKIYRMD